MDNVRVLTPLTVDTLTVSGLTTAEECGFIEAYTRTGESGVYRPGWWGVAKTIRRGKYTGRTLLNARAERGNFVWPQMWGVGKVHPTRVDVCCDFEGFAFTDEHRRLFTFRKGKSSTWYAGEDAQTIYIGSNASHTNLRLRIYCKTAKCEESDRERWTLNGWTGGEVWRVEAQVRERGLPRGLLLPENIACVWNDALARYRMCTVNPRTYSEQNKAPTHPLWEVLGRPERHTGMRRGAIPPSESDEAMEARLERLMLLAGQRLLPRLLERMKRAILVGGGNPHGKGREASRKAP